MKRMLSILMGMVLCAGCASLTKIGHLKPVCLERFEQDGKFGFKDEAGRVVILPAYDDAHDFVFGLAPVYIGTISNHYAQGEGKWGYINTKGEIVVPLTLSSADEFSDGLAKVWDAQGVRFIDPNGKTIITMGKGVNAGRFSEGVAPVGNAGFEDIRFFPSLVGTEVEEPSQAANLVMVGRKISMYEKMLANPTLTTDGTGIKTG